MQGPQDIGWRSLQGLLQALIPALLMNIHIVGLNQIFDVEIDKARPLKFSTRALHITFWAESCSRTFVAGGLCPPQGKEAVCRLQVNKPYLPLASGEFSMQMAVGIVSLCGLSALVIGLLVGSLPLMATLVGSAVLGVAYSVDLPFLRWKRHPVAAAACILSVR